MPLYPESVTELANNPLLSFAILRHVLASCADPDCRAMHVDLCPQAADVGTHPCTSPTTPSPQRAPSDRIASDDAATRHQHAPATMQRPTATTSSPSTGAGTTKLETGSPRRTKESTVMHDGDDATRTRPPFIDHAASDASR